MNQVTATKIIIDDPIKISDGNFIYPYIPIEYLVTYDDINEEYVATGPFIQFAMARSLDKLEKYLMETISFLWDNYSNENTNDLSIDARELQKELFSSFSYVL